MRRVKNYAQYGGVVKLFKLILQQDREERIVFGNLSISIIQSSKRLAKKEKSASFVMQTNRMVVLITLHKIEPPLPSEILNVALTRSSSRVPLHVNGQF